ASGRKRATASTGNPVVAWCRRRSSSWSAGLTLTAASRRRSQARLRDHGGTVVDAGAQCACSDEWIGPRQRAARGYVSQSLTRTKDAADRWPAQFLEQVAAVL